MEKKDLAQQWGPCEHDSCGEVAAENAGCVPRRAAQEEGDKG